MPEFENEQFKFPDEIDNKKAAAEPEIEIEIEDDTPEEDRGREPMPKEIVEKLETDELEKYDDEVKQKLKQLKKVWHDERRAKEAADKEREEALRYAQAIQAENKRIKTLLQSGEKDYVETKQSAAELELEVAKRAYREAYDAGDADKMIDAQTAMHNATFNLRQAQNFKLPSLQNEETDVQSNYTDAAIPAAPRPDQRAMDWQDNNPWFGSDDVMTAAALGVHKKLERSGVIVGSDEYYGTLDKTMRKHFADYFGEDSDTQTETDNTRTKPSTVVAPATRSTASNKLKLSTRQVQLAKKLGLTPEQYAQSVIRLENQNGR